LLPVELWDLSPVEVPPRAILPAPAPLGPSTPSAESLTSYIKRLADGLLVPVRRLVANHIAQGAASARGERRLWFDTSAYRSPMSLNGPTDRARAWAERLATLSGHAGVTSLTLGSWSDVLPTRAFVRPTLTYCPDCLAEWAAAKDQPRELLSWAIADVCVHHQRRLATNCANCRRVIGGFDIFKALAGICPFCGGSLAAGHGPGSPATSADLHLARVAEELVANAARGAEVNAKRIADLIELARGVCGSANSLASTIEVSPSLVSEWRRAMVRPSFVELVRIGQVAGVGLVAFLLGDTAPAGNTTLVPRRKQRPVGMPWEEVEILLAQALGALAAPTLTAVVSKMGRDRRAITARYPALTAAIKRRAANARAARRTDRVAWIDDTVRDAVTGLRGAGKRPSRRAVEAKLDGLSVREPAVRAAWLDAVSEPGPSARVGIIASPWNGGGA